MKPEVRKEKFKPGLQREFEIISSISDLYSKHRNLMTKPHRPEFYHVIWIQKGSPTHYVDFKPIVLKPDSILFVPKDSINVFDNSGTYDGKMILFTDRFFCRNTNDLMFLQNTILYNDFLNISQIQVDESINSFSDIFRLMEEETKTSNDNFQDDILRNLLHNFFLLAEREKRKNGHSGIDSSPYNDYLISFRRLLEDNFKNIKSVSAYASKLKITNKTLSNATTQLLGKTPKQIIDDRILLESKRLLIHTNATIKEIGFELGFIEPTNFIKYFHKHEQITPVDFRESYKR
jgi:AraC family transcriptional regulator, transcriptional activator of pobA